MRISMKKITAVTLALSMALSFGGCGSTAELVRKVGEAAARAAKAREEEQMEAAEAVEIAEPAATPEAALGKSKEDEFSKEDEASEEKDEKPAVVMPTPREGVIGLDDIFSGSGSDSDEDIDPDEFYFADDDEGIPYDTYVAQNIEKCKEDLAADNGPVQSEVESDTIQWFNATYAILTESNDGERTLVGGMERDLVNAVFMRYQLYTGWGIESREDADAVIEWLSEEGHRYEYEDLVSAFSEIGMLDVEKEYFDELIEESFGEYGSEAVNRLKTVYDCNKVCGENGILAWDLCRVNQVAAWCYVAGYYTLEESLEIQLQNSKELQEDFASWDEMMESYLYGFQYWYGDSGSSSSGSTAKRRNIYNSLKEMQSGPYSSDFDMELLRSWGT